MRTQEDVLKEFGLSGAEPGLASYYPGALRMAEHIAASARVCEWKSDDDDYRAWYTGCGHLFEFIADGPSENGAKFCQFCGGTLNVLTRGPQP